MLRYFTTLKSKEITSVAIGGFDGMHLAHMALVRELDENGVLLVIDKGFSNITPNTKRCDYVKNGCIFLDLTDIKDLSVGEFLNYLKSNFPALKKVVVGYDFRFGKDRKGNPKDFKKYFDVVIVDEVKVDDVSVHSAVIREYIKKADFKMAKKFLGRDFTIEATTIKGQGIGAKELVATINLKTDYLLPKDGVYATFTKVNNKWYKSVTFIGKRDTTDGSFAVETHLLDSKIDFLPDSVVVKFIRFIRDNKKFATIKALREQIIKDIKIAKDILSEYKNK